MTPQRSVKIIKGTGPGLSTAQLEDASMRLLLSRIRGSEPQISFTFIQRLLDELILRRHSELRALEAAASATLADADTSPLNVTSAQWLEGSDGLLVPDDSLDSFLPEGSEELEWDPASSFNLEELEYEELLPTTPSDIAELLDEDEEVDLDSLEPRHQRPGRAAVAACSRPERAVWEGAVNPWRVLVISLLVVFVMATGVVFMGCGHYDRSKSKQWRGLDQVEGVYIDYKNNEGERVEPSASRRAHIVAAITSSVDAFRKDYGTVPGIWVCEVYLGATVEENIFYVPCGTLNGGGCFTYKNRVMQVTAGECDNVPYLYHELTHAWLDDMGVPKLDNNKHEGEPWNLSKLRTAELRGQICSHEH